jgi:mannose-6-phosphate isomerase-like protein (cupin superfamily)
MLSPPSRMSPVIRLPGGRRPAIASAVRLFPQPDSPTNPTVSPSPTSSEISRRAWTSPLDVERETLRSVDLENWASHRHVRVHWYLTRGSMTAYRRSTIRLTTT